MRNFWLCVIIAAAATFLTGCAKAVKSGTNDNEQIYYNAWVKVKKDAHPEYLWWPASYGTPGQGGEDDADYVYILEDIEGDGQELFDTSYVYVKYTSYSLDGTVYVTTDKEISHRTGVDYDPVNYYGPVVWINLDYYLSVGLKDALNGVRDEKQTYNKMRVGGKRKFVVPGWLSVSARYDNIDYYLKNASGSDYIYDVEVVDITDDILQYQIDSIESYFYRHYGTRDSVYTGFYFKSLSAPLTDYEFPDDTTLSVYYIGRLLNGQVFDTNIEDTAKVWNLYDSSTSYEPVSVNWCSDSTDVTLNSSEVISGFASTIIRMGYLESAVGVFYSEFGYGASGSGSKIPGYSPLEFEIRIVDE